MIDVVAKVAVDALAGPVITTVVTSVLQKTRQRRKCSSLYALLFRVPESARDEIIRYGVDEGCWKEDTVRKLVYSFSHREVTSSVSQLQEKATPALPVSRK